MRMKDDHGLTLVQHGEKRVEFGRAEILPFSVRCQLDAVGLQRVESIDSLANGCIDIGQRLLLRRGMSSLFFHCVFPTAPRVNTRIVSQSLQAFNLVGS